MQDWCLQCGAGAPGSIGRSAGWRAGVTVLGATALLVAGASVAAYAAISKKAKHRPVVAAAVKAPLTGTTPPATTPALPGTPGAPTTPGAATTNPGTPTTIKATPPKIPLQTPTPKSSSGGGAALNNALFGSQGAKSTKSSTTSNPTKTTSATKSSGASGEESSKSSGAEGGEGSGSEPPSPILLDTNAASTYNPYAYPTTLFGDPSLAIDGEGKTAWTAQVDPASAPKMADGLVLDMKSAQKVATATVKTTTTGMSVEMYGANGHNLPAAITDPAWKRLTGSKVLKQKSTTLTLKTGATAYRFVLLWITKAPPGSTPSKPGSIAIDELELFPPA